MTSPDPRKTDSRGIQLWEERLRDIPGWLSRLSREDRPTLNPLGGRPVVVSGLGSSEAHGRFFQQLCLSRGLDCRFVSMAEFYAEGRVHPAGATLVVFSQGLSPNARIALHHHQSFERTLLFTAATGDNLRQAGKTDRAEFLERLLQEGVEVWPLAPAEEFSLLIRCQGPLAGYLEAIRAASSILPGFSISPPLPEELEAVLEKALEEGRAVAGKISAATALVVSGESIHYSQNLRFKWIEGIFERPPLLVDPLTFAHGPFQMGVATGGDILLFRTESSAERDLGARIRHLWDSEDGQVVEIVSPWPEPWAILFYEHFLNGLVLECSRNLPWSQLDWPGKGGDGPLYQLDRPFS